MNTAEIKALEHYSDPVYTPLGNLSAFIGDYSQNVYACSYNEAHVRCAWGRRGLSEDFKDYEGSDRRWEKVVGVDLDALMDELVKRAGAWPTGWLDGPVSLTPSEKARVGLPEVCFGDVMIQVMEEFPGRYSYTDDQVVELFYRVWDTIKTGTGFLSAAKAEVFEYIKTSFTNHSDYRELVRSECRDVDDSIFSTSDEWK